MKRYISAFARVSFLLAISSLVVYAASLFSVDFADRINGSVSVVIRAALSFLTFPLPFSLFELLIILSPVIVVFVVISAVRRARNGQRMSFVFSLLAVISLIFTSYVYTLGIGYRTTHLAERIDVEDDAQFSVSELNYAVNEVIKGVNAFSANISLADGETQMPYSKDEMSKKLIRAYDLMNEEYDLVMNYPSRVKPVYFSTVMSDLGISGIYSFFTGEANVNVEYPDYCLPFTAAHELAHQRGISRENEANFVAFLVCISSDDDYIRYSGYLNMYEYLASALYSADKELYAEAQKKLGGTAVFDMLAAREVYDAHKDSPLGKINERLNDAYLRANGTDGVVSYGYVVRLAVGYYQKQNTEAYN